MSAVCLRTLRGQRVVPAKDDEGWREPAEPFGEPGNLSSIDPEVRDRFSAVVHCVSGRAIDRRLVDMASRVTSR